VRKKIKSESFFKVYSHR